MDDPLLPPLSIVLRRRSALVWSAPVLLPALRKRQRFNNSRRRHGDDRDASLSPFLRLFIYLFIWIIGETLIMWCGVVRDNKGTPEVNSSATGWSCAGLSEAEPSACWECWWPVLFHTFQTLFATFPNTNSQALFHLQAPVFIYFFFNVLPATNCDSFLNPLHDTAPRCIDSHSQPKTSRLCIIVTIKTASDSHTSSATRRPVAPREKERERELINNHFPPCHTQHKHLY